MPLFSCLLKSPMLGYIVTNNINGIQIWEIWKGQKQFAFLKINIWRLTILFYFFINVCQILLNCLIMFNCLYLTSARTLKSRAAQRLNSKSRLLHFDWLFTFMHWADACDLLRLYIFVSMCVPWELNPQLFALLTQCSTTEPQEHIFQTFWHWQALLAAVLSRSMLNYLDFFLSSGPHLSRWKDIHTFTSIHFLYICAVGLPTLYSGPSGKLPVLQKASPPLQ